MKDFILCLFNFLLRIVMVIPFNNIRLLVLRLFGAKIGRHVFIGRRCEIRKPKNLIIGHNTVINSRTLLDCRGGTLQIGNNVDIAMESIIWTETHNPHDDYHRLVNLNTLIEDYCWIGCRSMIMPGLIVGYGAVVAAGSVVTKSIDPQIIVGGVPAKPIGQRKSNLKYELNYCPYFV